MSSHNEPLAPVRQPLQLVLMLLLSSALSIALSIARIWYSDAGTYFFLNWNLLLAWIPLGLAFLLLSLDRRPRRSPFVKLLVLGCWLLFFPNAPYIVSDLLHLDPRNGVPLWYDTIMLFSYAWNGLILGFLSLWIVQQLAARWVGWAASWLFVALTMAATGFGIYLGRFQRWNSWDVLVDPIGLTREVAHYVLNPLASPRTVGVTVLFAGFLLVAYLTVTLLPQALRPAGELPKRTERP